MPRERFRNHAQAAEEITNAISWFAQRDESSARRFIGAVNKAIESLLSTPERFGKYLFRTSCVRVFGFDYVVVYRDIDYLIHVIAVAHTSRRPGYWKDRLRDIEEG